MANATVLIVDDNLVNLKLLQVTLAGRGYDLRTAASAEEAIELMAGSCRPQLILLDIELPGIDGIELARLIKTDPATREICVVMLTASESHADEARAFAAGCDGFFRKPIDTRAFPKLAADFLARRTHAAQTMEA